MNPLFHEILAAHRLIPPAPVCEHCEAEPASVTRHYTSSWKRVVRLCEQCAERENAS